MKPILGLIDTNSTAPDLARWRHRMISAHRRLPRLMALLALSGGSLAAQPAGTALVRHAPQLQGTIEGSIHQLAAENTTLSGNTRITGDLLVPGTPAIQLNGHPAFDGTVEGPGNAEPANYVVTLNGGATLRHVVRRTAPMSFPTVAAPRPPAGTREVALNRTGESPGDFATLKNLMVTGSAGAVAVPPGTYGNFTAAGNSAFVLGIAGGTETTNYHFQQLMLMGPSRLEVVGPVVITVGHEPITGGEWGDEARPDWLKLDIAHGGLTLNGGARIHGYVTAPAGTVTINGDAWLAGGLTAHRLTLNGNGRLTLIPPPGDPPPLPDADRDGMDDAWETSHGLNPSLDDSNWDNDRDGLSNLAEFRLGLKPNDPDADADGLSDGDEVALGLDPTTPNPDTQPPTTPAGLAAGEVATDRVSLSWQPASDDLKVSGYLVYRDGQPIDTDAPIREPHFTDINLPDGEEFAYQVRSFDYAGNLSPLSEEVLVATSPADTDEDGLPDEWERKYFGEDAVGRDDDPDGDGLTNLQEFLGGTDPQNFYNGVDPLIGKVGEGEEPGGQIAVSIQRPDGTPWANAPYNFDSSATRRKLAPAAAGPFESYQLRVRAGADGIARAYLEPVNP